MRIRVIPALVVALFLATTAALGQNEVVVQTQSGAVAGTGTGIHVWKGIPYARGPVGELRWREPQPPEPWQGVRKATDFGPMCPQGNPAQLKPDMSEDCLNLNIWSGAKAGEKQPVFFWIHGGGFVNGSGRINGEPLARLGMVVVSINYRLGILGFMAHPELTGESTHSASGNYGLMDQIAALHWVRDNIDAFGGNPNHITIGGASAGATSVGYLLASPLAKGLFQGAMLDSASRLFLPDPGLEKALHGLTSMEHVGVQIGEHTTELRALSTADIMKRGTEVTDQLYGPDGSGRIGLKPESRVHTVTSHEHPWWAFTDGYVMPDELSKMFSDRRYNHAACMIGTCKDEGMGFTRNMPDLTVEGYHDYLNKYYPHISMKMFRAYPGTTPAEIRAAITRTITDSMFLYGSIRVADYEAAIGQQVYVSHFIRVPPGAPGALHVADGPYYLGTVKAGEGKYTADDEKISAGMMARLAAFVKTFNPNADNPTPAWPSWNLSQRNYLEIGDQMTPRPFRDEATMNLYNQEFGQ